MANDNVPPAVRERLRSIEDRLRELERRKLPPLGAPATAGQSFPLTVSFPGIVVTGTFSVPFYYSGDGAAFTQIRLSKRQVSSVSCTVDVTVNGGSVGSLTLAGGSLTTAIASTFALEPGDLFEVEVTAAGDAHDVSVECS